MDDEMDAHTLEVFAGMFAGTVPEPVLAHYAAAKFMSDRVGGGAFTVNELVLIALQASGGALKPVPKPQPEAEKKPKPKPEPEAKPKEPEADNPFSAEKPLPPPADTSWLNSAVPAETRVMFVEEATGKARSGVFLAKNGDGVQVKADDDDAPFVTVHADEVFPEE